ncbi:Ribosomal protein L1p/L10e family [Novymonas esmeraldas]|uniref:Ribosomal protein L1p/L10e family n=1 Tax=Novymonas esmeraldas TaxID=1808958 RepID=A0AAW0F7Y3_9TRYP
MSFLVRTEEAVKALLAFVAADTAKPAASTDVSDLFAPVRESHAVPIDIQIAFLAAPPAHRVPLYFPVPHEIVSGTLCIITPPPQRKYKDMVYALSEDGDAVAKRVRRVIDSKKLTAKVADPVAVRAFAKSYDHFIVYGVSTYPRQLTGEFLEHRKVPVWVSGRGKFADKLHKAVRTVVVTRRGDNQVTCRVGHTGMPAQEIIENIAAFLDKFVQHPDAAPLRNILHVRVAATGTNSRRVGLPIFGHTFHFTAAPAEPAEAPAKRSKVEA